MVTVFPVNAPGLLDVIVLGSVVALVIVGAVLAILSRIAKRNRMKLLVGGIIVLVAGAGGFVATNVFHQNSITVGQGSVLVSTPYFNLNISASQISKAYVVSLSSWNITIAARTDGSALGTFYSGYFTLSNGAKAEILSTNNSDLVLVLTSGTYVILGPQSFLNFYSSFDQSVMRLPNS